MPSIHYDELPQYTTENTRKSKGSYFPTQEDSQERKDALEKKRVEAFEPATNRERGIEDKKFVTFYNDRAAKEREAAGSVGQDKAYDPSAQTIP